MVVDACMCSEEGHEDTQLVELDEEVVSWVSPKARHVSTSEHDSRDSQLQQHGNRGLHTPVLSQAISSPHGAIPLRAEEERARQYERTKLIVITLSKALVSSTVHECSVSIVKPSVFYCGPVGCKVSNVLLHAKLLNLN